MCLWLSRCLETKWYEKLNVLELKKKFSETMLPLWQRTWTKGVFTLLRSYLWTSSLGSTEAQTNSISLGLRKGFLSDPSIILIGWKRIEENTELRAYENQSPWPEAETVLSPQKCPCNNSGLNFKTLSCLLSEEEGRGKKNLLYIWKAHFLKWFPTGRAWDGAGSGFVKASL